MILFLWQKMQQLLAFLCMKQQHEIYCVKSAVLRSLNVILHLRSVISTPSLVIEDLRLFHFPATSIYLRCLLSMIRIRTDVGI